MSQDIESPKLVSAAIKKLIEDAQAENRKRFKWNLRWKLLGLGYVLVVAYLPMLYIWKRLSK